MAGQPDATAAGAVNRSTSRHIERIPRPTTDLATDGFDLSNSPVAAAQADLDGRVLVQRTGAGTQGAVAATAASRLFAASLVCASATARAVAATGLGAPAYVITGRFPDDPCGGADDLATARLIERARTGRPLDAERTAAEVATSEEAARTLAVGEGHVDPADIAYATDVDRFDFAMEVERIEPGPDGRGRDGSGPDAPGVGGLRLVRRDPDQLRSQSRR